MVENGNYSVENSKEIERQRVREIERQRDREIVRQRDSERREWCRMETI